VRIRQRALFQQQLEMAAELGLNCVVHERDAMADVLGCVEAFRGRTRAVFHCFVGSVGDLDRVLGLESLVSYTGIVTFKNGAAVRETVAATPLDRMMVETDSPYLAPVPHRGRRCEPAYVRAVAEAVAQAKGCPLEVLGPATCATAEAFFRF
jgi:TatD DNase family protein